jgi:TolB-like protein
MNGSTKNHHAARTGHRLAGALAGMLLLCAGCDSHPAYYRGDVAAIAEGTPVAVLPLVNLTKDVNAPDIVMNAVTVELLATQRFRVIDPGVVEQAMQNERIRFSDRLPPETLHALAAALGVNYVFVGTVNEYQLVRDSGRDVPAVSFALRMIACDSGNIVWAATHAKRGDDSETMFTLGRIDTLEELTTVAAREMTSTLLPENTRHKAEPGKSTP